MRSSTTSTFPVAAATVTWALLLPVVLAHGDDHAMNVGDAMDMASSESRPVLEVLELPPSYVHHPEHRGALLTHIALMTLAWVFVLPLATMFSIARSRYTLPTQFAFAAINAFGVLASVIYDAQTPDLYPNNAHHKLGWLVTWVLSAQVLVCLLGRLAGILQKNRGNTMADAPERHSFIPVSQSAMDEHHRLHGSEFNSACRNSNDSAQGSARNTESLRSHSFSSTPETLASPTAEYHVHKEFAEDDGDVEADLPALRSSGPMRNLAVRLGSKISSRAQRVIIFAYDSVDRTSMILGFITLATGIITLARFFEGSEVFSGLAHWIKGGIFFWLGIFTLARWAGSFGELGWAWNIRPRSASKRWIPSAEFVESALIFTYGSTNIFLEHLGNWGGEWSFEDLEHISITVLFIGGGLCGMLIESTRIRDLLNTTVTEAVDSNYENADEHALALTEPETYSFSVNPIPALVILLLGIMMSSHTQASMISSMIHKQWGTMLTGASFARGLSYAITYLKPPTTILPSRPPTELLASFGLMTGGILFMASSSDTVTAMENNHLDVMFMYTVTMGLVGLLMAWEILVIAVKGWAVRKENPRSRAFEARYFPA